MKEQTQQDFLTSAKVTLNVTWDVLAELTDITPRALKTYRMPEHSQDYRKMPKLAKNSVCRVLEGHKEHSTKVP